MQTSAFINDSLTDSITNILIEVGLWRQICLHAQLYVL